MIGEKKPGDHSDVTFLSTGSDNSVSEGDTYKTIATLLVLLFHCGPHCRGNYIFFGAFVILQC